MAVRMRRLGTEWAYGERLTSTDLNDTFSYLDTTLIEAWQKNELIYQVTVAWNVGTTRDIGSGDYPSMTFETNYDPAEWNKMILKMEVRPSQGYGKIAPDTDGVDRGFTLLGNAYKGTDSYAYSRMYWDYTFYTFTDMPPAPQTIHLINGEPPWSIVSDWKNHQAYFKATLYAAKTTDLLTAPDVAKWYGATDHNAPLSPSDASWQDYTLGNTVSGPYSSGSSSPYYTSVHVLLGFDLSSISIPETVESILIWTSTVHTDESGRTHSNPHMLWNASTHSWEVVGQYRTDAHAWSDSIVQVTKCGYRITVDQLDTYLDNGYLYLALQTKAQNGGKPSIVVNEAGILAWHRPR